MNETVKGADRKHHLLHIVVEYNEHDCTCGLFSHQMHLSVLCPSLQHCETIEKAQVEIQRLRLERERYEESMKKAFMRGICALNMEALGMFNSTEGRPERAPSQDQHGL